MARRRLRRKRRIMRRIFGRTLRRRPISRSRRGGIRL